MAGLFLCMPVILRSPAKSPLFPCHSEERSDEESRKQKSQRNHTGSFTYTLPRLPFPGLLHDGPKNGAAAEIAGRLPLPPAAAARNSQDDRMFLVRQAGGGKPRPYGPTRVPFPGGHAGPPLRLPQKEPNRNPTKWIRFGEEEEGNKAP